MTSVLFRPPPTTSTCFLKGWDTPGRLQCSILYLLINPPLSIKSIGFWPHNNTFISPTMTRESRTCALRIVDRGTPPPSSPHPTRSRFIHTSIALQKKFMKNQGRDRQRMMSWNQKTFVAKILPVAGSPPHRKHHLNLNQEAKIPVYLPHRHVFLRTLLKDPS